MPSNDLFSLPIGPEELCFDKNEFIKKSFSVDEFLHEHRNAAGLEEMRDDLGLYLKVLRSAMIELINEDYVDFVNLASNLVGLDQSIDGIQSSLVQLKDEILMIKQMLADTMHELSDCLAEKLLLKQQLKAIHSVRRVHMAIANLDTLLAQCDTCPVNLERSALEIVQLRFNMQFCADILARKHGEKVSMLHSSLMTKIQSHFLTAFVADNVDALQLCLRMYCTLNECRSAEELVRTNIVAPYMQTVISESALQNCPAGLHGIYRQILHFITTRLQTILKMSGANGAAFDFLLNSCWLEIERRLVTQMSSIFAPGNPDLFYQKYQHTMDFLAEFERMIVADGRERWRAHPQYVSFQTRWNLPVYFQIRFQEIGGELEAICSKAITSKLLIVDDTSEFKLTPFCVAWQCITKCWSTGVYLSEIFIRFWTLTVQLIARIGKWLDDSLSQSADLTDNIEFYVALHIDAQHLATKLPALLVDIVAKSPAGVQQHRELLQQCFDESDARLRDKLQHIERYVADEILRKSLPNIRQVSDIPRLYRKTNKDVPTKPCVYVEQMLEMAKSFHRTYVSQWDDERMVSFLCKLFNAINVKYYMAVDDVLTSVQKTEESLRRLKNLREKSTTLTASMSADRLTAGGMSDDDKIRLQLHVDTMYWTNEIELLHVDRSAVDKLPELIQLVEDSTKIRIASK